VISNAADAGKLWRIRMAKFGGSDIESIQPLIWDPDNGQSLFPSDRRAFVPGERPNVITSLLHDSTDRLIVMWPTSFSLTACNITEIIASMDVPEMTIFFLLSF
jgi:hypothetical protein